MRRRRARTLAAALSSSCIASCSADYHDTAIARAGAGAPNHEVLSLFRAAAFLDKAPTSQAWSNLGVALLHQSSVSNGSLAQRYGIWSLISFDLSRRMDPLMLVGSSMVDPNIQLLVEKCPSVGKILEANRRA